MEKEHLIIIAILGVILYMCMNKSEGFYVDMPVNIPEHIRYQNDMPVNIPQRIRYQDAPLTLSQNPDNQPITMNRIRSNMNIMGSQYVTGHIRRDRRNNMMNSMLYGYQNDCATDPAQCGQF
jgi:hypothetical protein